MNEQGQTKESEGDPFMNFTSFTMPTKGAFKKMTRKGGERIRLSEGLLYVGKRCAPRPFLVKRPFPDAKVKEGLKKSDRPADGQTYLLGKSKCAKGKEQQQVNYSEASFLFMLFFSSEVSTVVYRQIPAPPHLLMPRRPKRFRPSSLFLLLPPSLCLTLSQRTKGGGRGRGRKRRTQTRRRRTTKKSHPDRGEGLPD